MEIRYSEALLKTESYQEFLRVAFACLKQKNRHLSYASIARRAGLSARSYVREIIMGKKPPTTKVFPSLSVGLQLSSETSLYLQLLLALEKPEFNSKKWSRADIERRLEKIRTSARKKSESNRLRSKNPAIFEVKHWPLLFAALGSCEEGASVAEISRRTGLSAKICSESLARMQDHEVVRFVQEKERYFPEKQHVIFQFFSDPQRVQDLYVSDLRKLQARALQQFKRDDHLFFDSSFSVPKARLPALKKALWDTLLQFADENEVANGDAVVTLVSGLFPAAVEPTSL